MDVFLVAGFAGIVGVALVPTRWAMAGVLMVILTVLAGKESVERVPHEQLQLSLVYWASGALLGAALVCFMLSGMLQRPRLETLRTSHLVSAALCAVAGICLRFMLLVGWF